MGSGDGSTCTLNFTLYMYWYQANHCTVLATILLAGTIIRSLNHAPLDISIVRNPQLIKIGSLNSPSLVGHLITCFS